MFDTTTEFTLDADAVRAWVRSDGGAIDVPTGTGQEETPAADLVAILEESAAARHPTLHLGVINVDELEDGGFVVTVYQDWAGPQLTSGWMPFNNVMPDEPIKDPCDRAVHMCNRLVEAGNDTLARYRGLAGATQIVDNEDRADLGGAAVRATATKTGVASAEDAETAVRDVLAYIAHFCDRLGLDPDTTFADSLRSYHGDQEDGPFAATTLAADRALASQ